MRGSFALLLLAGCSALTQPRTDAGTASSSDASVSSGTDSSGTDGGGNTSNNDGGTLVEEVDAGPRFSFTQYSFETTPPTPPFAFKVRGMAQRPDGELWVAFAEGSVYRARDGQFTLQKVGVFTLTNAEDIVDVVATETELFIVREDRVLVCTTPCDSVSDFTTKRIFGGVKVGIAGCASGAKLFVTAAEGSATSLYLADGSGQNLNEVSTTLPTSTTAGCATLAGAVSVVGSTSIGTREANGAITTQNITGANTSWRSLALTASSGLLVGYSSGGGEIARRSGSSWARLPNNVDLYGFDTVVALGDDSFLIGGHVVDASSPSLFLTSGSTVSAMKTTLPSLSVDRAVAIGPDEVVLGGSLNTFGSYIVVRGIRR